MDESKNHIEHYSAADIERYHKGEMNAGEMHALEKAAMDDPFLADALEGYQKTDSDSVTSDINALKARLASRTSSGKLVEMSPSKSSPWLRIAAILILVLGLGYLVFDFSFRDESREVAVTNKQAAQPGLTDAREDTAVSAAQNESAFTLDTISSSEHLGTASKIGKTIPGNQDAGSTQPVITDSLNYGAFNTLTARTDANLPVAGNEVADNKMKNDKATELAGDEEKEKALSRKNTEYRFTTANPNAQGVVKSKIPSIKTNLYRARVVDENNNPVPFPNVTNVEDNVGTYTDTKGYFSLISPDSVLNLQVRSIGFQQETKAMHKNDRTEEIVMQEDPTIDAIVLDSSRRNSNRARVDPRVFKEPEPADGWHKYDTYIANNVVLPKEQNIKQPAGEVELSFDIDKNGNPINITVEKSLCTECDQEAIRLIKAGPKWKRKGKSRAKVTVPF